MFDILLTFLMLLLSIIMTLVAVDMHKGYLKMQVLHNNYKTSTVSHRERISELEMTSSKLLRNIDMKVSKLETMCVIHPDKPCQQCVNCPYRKRW